VFYLPNGIKVGLVEYQKILIIILKALDGMRFTFWKIPNISNLEFGDLVATILINGRHEHRTGVDIAPFSLTTMSSMLFEKLTWIA
jgi:hypothetical protein